MNRIVMSGASGLIGSALAAFLEAHERKVTRLVRRSPTAPNEARWDPMASIPPQEISGFDTVIHLSGENVAGLWTAAKKQRIRESRVVSTQNLSRALARAEKKPALFLCASAIGYYGTRGDEVLTEESPSGSGFLAEVCHEWETATVAAREAGIRVVNLRIGIVLSRHGSALKQMLLPFRLGMGGRIGSGRQWWSWIHIDDVVYAVWHIVRGDAIAGPVNMTAPNPVTNAEFTRTLAGVLHRPALLPIPAFATRLAFGEFADDGLLASARIVPNKLLALGFEFRFPELVAALQDVIGRR
ncbi:MAG TPA: TIGR01777 family oxidoreductase [Terriglobales bacterium]|nr:TIGR01777 family oxidoreductase [Terriglobales bacterium]